MSPVSWRRLGAALALAPVLAFAAGAPRVESGYSYATPAPGITAAGFLTVVNGPTADRLLSAESPRARRTEIHEMRMDGGVMRMRALADGLPLAAGARLELAPGGYHLMLIDPPQPFAVGESVPVNLVFEKAGPIAATLQVRARDAEGTAAHGRDAHSHH